MAKTLKVKRKSKYDNKQIVKSHLKVKKNFNSESIVRAINELKQLRSL